MTTKIDKSEQEWRELLGEERFQVTRKKGTERAFSGEYYDCKTTGTYVCACCQAPLFDAHHKYDSGSGWPSFWQPLSESAIRSEVDNSYGMQRTEVLCGRCDAHLGHVFEDGPPPTGLRYCINSLSLQLQPESPEQP